MNPEANPKAHRACEGKVVERMQDLLSTNNDSHTGFRKAAEVIADEQLAEMFGDLAREHSDQAAELGRLLASHGVEPRQRATRPDVMRRFLLDFLATMNGGNPAVILAAAERGQDQLEKLHAEIQFSGANPPQL